MKKIALATVFGAVMGLSTLAQAQQGPTSGVPAVGPDFQADAWTYGPRYDRDTIEVWNPVRAKMEAGEHVIAITTRGPGQGQFHPGGCVNGRPAAWLGAAAKCGLRSRTDAADHIAFSHGTAARG